MPAAITPMMATLADKPPTGEDWIFEVKWDGVRAICFIEGERVRLVSRNGNSCEKQYPELSVLHHYIGASSAILDGEIVILDKDGISRFELLQNRINNADPNSIAHMARSRPVTYFAFDLLFADGYDLRQVTLIERKRALQEILTPAPVLRFSEGFAGSGEQILDAARETGLEGILAKRTNSCYEPRRSREWLKLKLTSRDEFLICGFTEGEREYFSSLVLGMREGGKLIWVGNVGTGFDEKTLEVLYRRLKPLIISRPPFEKAPKMLRPATWVRPELVCTVKFANWTEDRKLRAPVYLGLRNDLDAEELKHDTSGETAPSHHEPLLQGTKENASLTVDGKPLKFTNLNKFFYPADGYTKRDVINYYNAVADLLLPHLKDRPLSLKRYPNGIAEEYFFQKNVPENWEPWLRREAIYSEHNQGPTNYVFAEDRASLLYLANLACIDQNPWLSRSGSLDNPDFVLIDLDPQEECPFEWIVEAAQIIHAKLDLLELEGYPKTTGGRGMHIYVPVEPIYSYDDTRIFAEILAGIVVQERPELFTTPRAVAKREKNKVYFDYLQNGKSKTIAAPYVLRAYPGAPAATPLAWHEVTPGLRPAQFNMRNVLERFDRVGDLFAGVLSNRQDLTKSMEKLEKLVREGNRKTSGRSK